MKLLEGQGRIPSGCAIAAMISRDGTLMSGEKIISGMKVMHERSNGLGGGFAAYDIYPHYRNFYALHLFYSSPAAQAETEHLLNSYFPM